MAKLIKQILISIFFALLLNSCGGEDSHVGEDGQTPVGFSPQVDNAAVKAEAISTGSLKNFGVYASVNSAVAYLLMENEQVYKTESNSWIYDHIKYWPLNQTVDFLAYSPYGNDNVTVSYADKTITALIPGNPENQFDLMAVEMKNKTATDGPVGLLFEHLLSRIDFAVRVVDNDKGFTITLNGFELVVSENALFNSGVYHLSNAAWQTDDYSFMTAGNFPLAKTPAIVSDKQWEYSLMLLPQEHRAGDMTVNISYSILSADASLTTKEASVPLSQLVAEKGKKYTYNFQIAPTGMTLDIDVSPWNTGGWGSEVYPDTP